MLVDILCDELEQYIRHLQALGCSCGFELAVKLTGDIHVQTF
jgi:hypothetical protein